MKSMMQRIRRGLFFAAVATLIQLPGYAFADQVFGDSFRAVSTPNGILAPGVEIDCDLPHYRCLKNVGGSDGSGLCVFTSIEHFLDWFSMKEYLGFRKYMEGRPGGGWPEKVTKELRAYCEKRKLEMPDILQVTNGNIDLLAEAVQSGHMCGVTYCYSPTGRYNGQRIAHMVNCVGARVGPNKLWAILDNNYVKPEEGLIEWMDEATFKKVWLGNGGGWFITVLNRPDPPPIPRNEE